MHVIAHIKIQFEINSQHWFLVLVVNKHVIAHIKLQFEINSQPLVYVEFL